MKPGSGYSRSAPGAFPIIFMRRYVAIAIALTIAALAFRLFLTLRLPNDEDDDGKFYAQIARNLLDHHGYSGEEEGPFVPTYVRVPGYPLFVAGVYAVFGRDNNTAVRIIQVFLDVATCWLVALLALAWTPIEWAREKRRRAMLIALALAAACPFTAIYTDTLLTETWATLLATAVAVVATLGLKKRWSRTSALFWLAAGLLGGVVTMLRPDCALFLGGAGMMFVTASLVEARMKCTSGQPRHARARSIIGMTLVSGIALCVGFASALAPWTIRNARVFGVFQPVAPPHANMPDEFAPMGYIAWLRTWVDAERYVSPIEDGLDLYPILIERIPPYAFDSPEERDAVQALLDRYNNPIKPAADPSDDDDDAGDPPPTVKMTPEIDAKFGQIASARIARNQLRYYLLLPLKRAQSLWFDTHSQYYPFQGQLFPLSDLDKAAHQQYWLSLFALLTGVYTILALAGLWVMLRSRSSRRWILLLALLILPRLAFLAAQEHPESRYTVEFFPLVAAAGSLALAHIRLGRFRRGSAASNSHDRVGGGDV
jgi:hypothetical protein